MNCNTTHYRANSSSVPGDPTIERLALFPARAEKPAAVLEYQDAGMPFPLALGVAHQAVERTCLAAYTRYSAIEMDYGTELLSLLHERGRVAGAVARGPAGDVTYRARLVVVTTGSGGAPVRAEAGAATRARTYPEEQAALALERPESWPAEAAMWLGPGLAVAAYPTSAKRLRVELTAAPGVLARATAAGAEALRRLIAETAPALEGPLKSLDGELPAAVHPERSRVATWVADRVALTGPAARAMSACGLGAESQSVIDAHALAAVMSKSMFTGDFSRPALKPYETARRPAAERVARLAHDLHTIGSGRSAFRARARRLALARLARSPALRRKLVRTLAGLDQDTLTLGDRLRLAGLLPLGAREAV